MGKNKKKNRNRPRPNPARQTSAPQEPVLQEPAVQEPVPAEPEAQAYVQLNLIPDQPTVSEELPLETVTEPEPVLTETNEINPNWEEPNLPYLT